MAGGIENSQQFWGIQVARDGGWRTLQYSKPGFDVLHLANSLQERTSSQVRVGVTDRYGNFVGPVIPHTPEAMGGMPAAAPVANKPKKSKAAPKTTDVVPAAKPKVYDSRGGKTKRIM